MNLLKKEWSYMLNPNEYAAQPPAHGLQKPEKEQVLFLLNMLGLGIGVAVFLLIALYVRFERSYENFVPNAENIY